MPILASGQSYQDLKKAEQSASAPSSRGQAHPTNPSLIGDVLKNKDLHGYAWRHNDSVSTYNDTFIRTHKERFLQRIPATHRDLYRKTIDHVLNDPNRHFWPADNFVTKPIKYKDKIFEPKPNDPELIPHLRARHIKRLMQNTLSATESKNYHEDIMHSFSGDGTLTISAPRHAEKMLARGDSRIDHFKIAPSGTAMYVMTEEHYPKLPSRSTIYSASLRQFGTVKSSVENPQNITRKIMGLK